MKNPTPSFFNISGDTAASAMKALVKLFSREKPGRHAQRRCPIDYPSGFDLMWDQITEEMFGQVSSIEPRLMSSAARASSSGEAFPRLKPATWRPGGDQSPTHPAAVRDIGPLVQNRDHWCERQHLARKADHYSAGTTHAPARYGPLVAIS